MAGIAIALQPDPTLYAVPVMLTSLACVRTAYYLPSFEEKVYRVNLLRYGGYVLAGLAFALALGHPAEPSAFYSRNTFATALLGLALFATSLGLYRQPPYLYLSFAAFVAAYFSVGDLIPDVRAAIEGIAGRALGYQQQLPGTFRSLHGIVFSIILGLSSLRFSKRWNDERLARHLHYMGLPLSLAACGYSCLEPKAAMLCLPAYAILFAIAVRLFAQPALIYLACASFAGAVFFTSTVAQAGLPVHVLAIFSGAVFWLVCRVFVSFQAGEAYCLPLIYASRAMSAIALLAATASVLPPGQVTFGASLTFLSAGLLYILIGRVRPRGWLAYLAVIAANVGILLALLFLNRSWQLSLSRTQFGLAAALSGVAQCLMGRWFNSVGERRTAVLGRASRLCLYVFPLFHLALAQAALSAWLSAEVLGQHVSFRNVPLGNLASASYALALSGGTLVMITAFAYPATPLAYLAVWAGVAAFGVGALVARVVLRLPRSPATLGVKFGALALLLHLAGERITSKRPPPGPLVSLYREPLLHTAFIAVGLSWLFCALRWDSYQLIAMALTLTTLTLALSTRVYPAMLWAHLAIASALGVWLCVFQITTGGVVAAPAVYGVVLAGFALALLAVAEWCRRIWASPGPASALQIWIPAFSSFTRATTFVAAVLAIWKLANAPAVILTFFLVAVARMWLTRFERNAGFVYISIASAIASALCLCAWRAGSFEAGVATGWLAFTAALSSLALWCAGFVSRRGGKDEFYVVPCFHLSLLMTAGVFALVVAACLRLAGSLWLCVLALLLNALTYLLLTTVWSKQALTYAAVISIASASYVTLLTVGVRSPGAYGLVAASLAIALWLAGFLCQRSTTEGAGGIYFRPLFVSSLLLTFLSVLLAFTSPRAMLLVSVAFLLMVKSFSAAEWLYAVVGSAGCSIYFAYFAGPPDERLVVAGVTAAFLLWTLGVIVQRVGPALCVRLQVSRLSYEFPLFHGALAASIISAGLRASGAFRPQFRLSPVLAVLYLLMVKPYPYRGWVHLSVALFTWSILSWVSPLVTSPLLWLLAGMVLAHLWLFAQRRLERVELPLCSRIGLPYKRYSEVAGQWSVAAFALASVLAGGLIVLTILQTVFSVSPLVSSVSSEAWWGILLTLALAAAYVLLHEPFLDLYWIGIGLHAALVLMVWWLGAPASPAVLKAGISAAAYYPLATVTTALFTALIGARLAGGEGRREIWPMGGVDEADRAMLAGYAGGTGIALTIASLALTKGMVSLPTTITLLFATTTFAVLTVWRQAIELTYAAGVVFTAACLYAALELETRLLNAPLARAISLSLGATAAAFLLLAGTGWLRRMRPGQKARGQEKDTGTAGET